MHFHQQWMNVLAPHPHQHVMLSVVWILAMLNVCSCILLLFFKVYFIDCAITVVQIFLPLSPSTQYPPSLQQYPLSSCLWVMHISSLASPFPILFLISPCLFCTYKLYFLISAPFLPFLPFLFLASNSQNDLNTYDSVPVLVVCLVCFCFYFLRFSCW